VTENLTDTPLSDNLNEAILGFAQSIENFKNALKACREAGWTDIHIRDCILLSMPEEERAAFAQQWPYFSMMLNVL
jgi:hypothetical protein